MEDLSLRQEIWAHIPLPPLLPVGPQATYSHLLLALQFQHLQSEGALD